MSVGYALPQGSYWNSPAPEAMAFQAASAAPAYAVAATAPTPHASRDLTLQRISEAADKDVEMQDVYASQITYVVLDTNILIHFFDVLKQFNEDLETLVLPVVIIIPNVLLGELDGLKKSDQVGWFASRASTWILDRMRARKHVKVQATWETTSPRIIDPRRQNDLTIWDCCRYFMEDKGGRVVLYSNDNNLASQSEAEGIKTVTPQKYGWTSLELARAIDIPGIDYRMFQRPKDDTSPHYHYRPDKTLAHRITAIRPETRIAVVAPEDDGEDRMDVDDDGTRHGASHTNFKKDYTPSHALDALHLQVIDHFTLLLRDLAFRIRTAAGDVRSASQWATEYERKLFKDWILGDCIKYLGSKKPLKPTSPSLQRFMRRPYEDLPHEEIWRRGQDWSRQDWLHAMGALVEIGTKFEDGAILASVELLRVETERVFNLPMRPTGL